MLKTSILTLWAARASAVAAIALAVPAMAEPGNTLCPIMTEDSIDPEYTLKVGDTEVGLCCSACEKKWKANEKYYIKAGLDVGILPQFKGKETELGLDKVELLPQRFCPVTKVNIVTPDSPTVDYKGEKIYFYAASGVRKWNADPEKYAKEAIEAGILPQLKGK